MTSKTLQLPCGYEVRGRVERSVEIVKLKGRVQRDVARLANKKSVDTYAVLEAILKPTVKSVGSERATPTLMGEVLLADRDWMLFEIVKHSRGPEVTLNDTCPACKEPGEYPGYNLDDLDVTYIEDKDALWWDGNKVYPQEARAQLGPEEILTLRYRVFRIEDTDLGTSALFRYPTGRHQQGISKLGENEIEALWKLMSTTLIQWKCPELELEHAPKGGVKTAFWEEVDMEVLDWAQSSFADAMPGVNPRVELECYECGHEFNTIVRPTDFLFRGRKREKAKS
jgi:hypothetical protein